MKLKWCQGGSLFIDLCQLAIELVIVTAFDQEEAGGK